jgi:DNA-binding NarL/FixJ family response regulator
VSGGGGARAAATRLLVIDDHPLVREGLRMLLDAAGDLRVIGTSASVAAALAALERERPEVVLLDLDLGEEDGLEALPRILAAAPSSRVLIVTALRDRARDAAALAAGARGLVLKDASPEQLVQAVRVVAAGGLWFDPRVLQSASRRRDAPRPAAADAAHHAVLTARERRIVELVAKGLRNEDVARHLGLSEKTVRNQLTAVFEKLGVRDRLQLIVYAHQHGLGPAAR